eukprot:TRINITY_DN12717_c0_g1_i2.p1 TRINITY_DN12717_c0_g1~~TRINITY_DN12717_c0_g1_i2.p1  ORF type:complete len:186 (+),score=21.46 TRINITY_DN12717_c0_g1_i2:371-928(+)
MLGNSFKEYARVYNLYLSSDICENVVNSDSTLVLSDCKQILNGILEFGIQTSTVTFIENFREWIIAYNQNMTTEFQIELYNRLDIRENTQLYVYLRFAINAIKDAFDTSFNNYIESFLEFESIKFGCLLISLVLLLLLAVKFIYAMNSNYQGIKQIMNLISITIISQNSQLKELITQEDFKQKFK